MAGIRDSFVDLENHHLQLEQSVAKLRSSLHHWQAWEIEYEGMREDILGLGPDHTQAELENLGKTVDEAGVFAGQSTLLTPQDVEQNVKTLSSLLRTAEGKYEVSQVLSQPEVRNEDGLPLTEIHEELDEEGNVISSSILEPGEATPQMVEALRKAGVKLPEQSETPQQDAKQPSQAPHRTSGSDVVAATTTMSRRGDAEVEETQQSTSISSESPNGDSKRRPSRPRKRVSFANGTKEEVTHTPKSRSPQERPPDEIARIIKEILDQHYADVREAIPPPDLRDGKLAVEYGEKMSQLEKAREKRLKAAKVYQQWKRGFLEEIERDKEDSSREESAAAILEPDKNMTSMDELQKETDVPVTSELIINGEATRSDVIALGEGSKGRSNSRQHTPTRNAPSDTTSTSKEPITNNPFDAVIPINESPEDAALRRQMIQYNMDEVGAIVAELNLDEDEDKDEDFSEDYSDEERDDGSSVEDDEDHFGRTKRRVVNDDYLAEMEALQRKLKNVGPDLGKAIPSMPNETGKEQQRPNGKLANGIPGGSKPTAKKGVRFAEELDVQEAPLAITTNGSKSGNEPKVPPKTGLKPVLASVIERPYTASTAPDAAPEPDEYNPALVQKEVATEYHKMRNLMIQRQGGFMAQENEQAEVPLTEAEGGPKKVSRFKAARLGRI